jgi:hypothetical protein
VEVREALGELIDRKKPKLDQVGAEPCALDRLMAERFFELIARHETACLKVLTQA